MHVSYVFIRFCICMYHMCLYDSVYTCIVCDYTILYMHVSYVFIRFCICMYHMCLYDSVYACIICVYTILCVTNCDNFSYTGCLKKVCTQNSHMQRTAGRILTYVSVKFEDIQIRLSKTFNCKVGRIVLAHLMEQYFM